MNEDFHRFMEEHNPFYFRDAREHFCTFVDYAKAYEGMLDRLYEQAPKGYIDLVLFLTTYVHMERKQAERFLDNFYRSGALNRSDSAGYNGICLVDWKRIDDYRDLLERIATGLHWITESKFNRSMFNQGLNMFKLKMKMF